MASSNNLVKLVSNSDSVIKDLSLNKNCNAAERISQYSNLSSIIAAYNAAQKIGTTQRSITTIKEERVSINSEYNPYDNYDHNYEELDGINSQVDILTAQNSSSGMFETSDSLKIGQKQVI